MSAAGGAFAEGAASMSTDARRKQATPRNAHRAKHSASRYARSGATRRCGDDAAGPCARISRGREIADIIGIIDGIAETGAGPTPCRARSKRRRLAVMAVVLLRNDSRPMRNHRA